MMSYQQLCTTPKQHFQIIEREKKIENDIVCYFSLILFFIPAVNKLNTFAFDIKKKEYKNITPF